MKTPELLEQENLIVPAVFHTHSKLDFKTQQVYFKQTCFAIQTIISKKLYKCVAANLEQYFKNYWDISRAKTYRMMECAAMIKVIFLLIFGNEPFELSYITI